MHASPGLFFALALDDPAPEPLPEDVLVLRQLSAALGSQPAASMHERADSVMSAQSSVHWLSESCPHFVASAAQREGQFAASEELALAFEGAGSFARAPPSPAPEHAETAAPRTHALRAARRWNEVMIVSFDDETSNVCA